MSRSESGGSDTIPADFWNLLLPLGHFAWHWARQCTDTRAFYVAALSMIFFLLDFVSGDLTLTGFQLWTWTSYLHCFGALEVCLGAQTWPDVLARRMRVIIAIVVPQIKGHNSAWPFPWIVKSTWKTKATIEGFSTLIPQTIHIHHWFIWGDDAFENLHNFSLWHISSFYSSHCKHAMSLQQQHSLYGWGNFMRTDWFVVCHQPHLCHSWR